MSSNPVPLDKSEHCDTENHTSFCIQRNRPRWDKARGSSFQGKYKSLKGSVYDAIAGKDTFLKTTKEIAEYIGTHYNDAREFRTGMVELCLPYIVGPKLPADSAKAVKWKNGSGRSANMKRMSKPGRRILTGYLHLSLFNAHLPFAAIWYQAINGGPSILLWTSLRS